VCGAYLIGATPEEIQHDLKELGLWIEKEKGD